MPESGAFKRLISIDEVNSTLPPDALTAVTLLYIALPNLIFLGGWLKLPYAVIAIPLLLVSLWQFARTQLLQWRQPYSLSALLLIVVIGFVWCSLGGAGHFGFTNPDWIVRDTVLGDLTLADWPPYYSTTDGFPHILRTAFGFFFPPALAGKWLGMGALDVSAYVWEAFGACLFLLLLPLPRQAGKLLLLTVFVAIMFSGMDYLGIVLLTGTTPLFPLRLEWWVPFSYPSLTGQMYWAPNHTLPLWLVTTLFYRHWGHRSFAALMVVLLPLLMIWTPFAVAAIMPFVGIAMLRWLNSNNKLSHFGVTLIQFITAALLTYLTVRLLTLSITAIPGAPTIEVAPNKDRFVLKYLLFALMEFAVLGLLLARALRHSQGLFWLAFAILALLPLYQYGPSNDTMLRLSTPCLVIFLILTINLIRDWATLPCWRALPDTAWMVAIVLVIGFCTPFNEIWRAATFHRTPPNYGVSLVEHERGEPPHYVGVLDKPDLLLMLREPGRVPDRNERKAQGVLPVFSEAR